MHAIHSFWMHAFIHAVARLVRRMPCSSRGPGFESSVHAFMSFSKTFYLHALHPLNYPVGMELRQLPCLELIPLDILIDLHALTGVILLKRLEMISFILGAIFIHAFIHSFIHSCIHSFIHASIHSLMHAFIHSCINSFDIHSSIHSFMHAFIHSFIHSFMHPFIHLSIHLLLGGGGGSQGYCILILGLRSCK